MGAGRRTETSTPASSTHYQTSGSSHTPLRNLRQGQLAGVIFGCTYETITECLSKQLFGLPYGHLPYVKNVKPGLPTFLFNYSDRKLHGIFKAASDGQLNIDRFAWSSDGSTLTRFPAQVRVSTKTKCLPLPESKYKSVLSDNYHTGGHFYFELDHAQTKALISLFRPAPVPAIRNEPILSVFPAPICAVPNKWERPLPYVAAKTHTVPVQVMIEQDKMDVNQFSDSSHSHDMVPYNLSDLDSTKGSTESVNDDHQNSNAVHDKQHDKMDVLRKLEKLSALRQNEAHSSEGALGSASDESLPQNALLDATVPKDSSNATLQCDAPKDNTSFVQSHGNTELLQIINELSRRTEAMEKKQIESDQEILFLREMVKDAERRVQQLEGRFEKLQLEFNCSASRGGAHSNVEGPSILLIGGHNGITWLSSLDSFCPATDILEPRRPMSSARAYAAVAALKDHVFVFGGGNGSLWYNTVECYNRMSNEWIALPCLHHKKGSLVGATLNDKIFAIGGGDGSRCFAEVEIFDPALGKWVYSQSMQQPRFTPAAAELDGTLYVVGGFDGNISAERYDPREGFWTQLPSMSTRRGSHSVVVLGEAIYALGGYNGSTMTSSVEIFDPRADSWRTGTPSSIPRAYGCSVAVDGNVYLLGGAKNSGEYVETVEVYNDRQGWSIPGYSVTGKRAFASAVVV